MTETKQNELQYKMRNNLEPLDYLDEAMLDFTIVKACLYAYSYEYQWNKWIREN